LNTLDLFEKNVSLGSVYLYEVKLSRVNINDTITQGSFMTILMPMKNNTIFLFKKTLMDALLNRQHFGLQMCFKLVQNVFKSRDTYVLNFDFDAEFVSLTLNNVYVNAVII
jgi:hypothetical protein